MGDEKIKEISVKLRVNPEWPITFPDIERHTVKPKDVMEGICQESSGWYNNFHDMGEIPPVPLVISLEGEVFFPSYKHPEEFDDTIAQAYARQNPGSIYIPSKGNGGLKFTDFIEAIRRIASRPDIEQALAIWKKEKGKDWRKSLDVLAAQESEHLDKITLWYNQNTFRSGFCGKVIADNLPNEIYLKMAFGESDNFEPSARELSSDIDVSYSLNLKKKSNMAGALRKYFHSITDREDFPQGFSLKAIREDEDDKKDKSIRKYTLSICSPDRYSDEGELPISTNEMLRPFVMVYNEMENAIKKLKDYKKSEEKAKESRFDSILGINS